MGGGKIRPVYLVEGPGIHVLPSHPLHKDPRLVPGEEAVYPGHL